MLTIKINIQNLMILLQRRLRGTLATFIAEHKGSRIGPLSASLESFNKDIDKNRATPPVRGSKAFAGG
jgi:hypothetical protein